MSTNYEGVVIADIHIGAVDTTHLKYELDEVFIHYIETLEKLDFIIIAGDYFDHRLTLGEDASSFAISLMDKIVKISKKHHKPEIGKYCPIRIVYGTESHEVNQYTVFSIYENRTDIDFKVIHSVSDEELLPDMKVLYIPEEYILSKEDTYRDYLYSDKEYDYIFGHGIITDIMIALSPAKFDGTRKRVPTFSSEELENVCRGEVYFGHYHVNSEVDESVYYCGSYTRWCFNEETPKGFYHITCNPKKLYFHHEFIENELAPKYMTVSFNADEKLFSSTDDLIDEMNRRDKTMKDLGIEHTRYVFNLPDGYENDAAFKKVLSERYRDNSSVKIKIDNDTSDVKYKADKEVLNEMKNKYGFIFDPNLSTEDKVSNFLNTEYHKEMSPEKVKHYLTISSD